MVTWTNNYRCKSRLLLRCKVTLVSRIPRSLLICEGSLVGENGSSWSIPIFILSSQLNDIGAGDEDQIPPNGNPHPVNGFFLNVNDNQGNQVPRFFEDVGTLIRFSRKTWIMDGNCPLRPLCKLTTCAGGSGFSKKGNWWQRMSL